RLVELTLIDLLAGSKAGRFKDLGRGVYDPRVCRVKCGKALGFRACPPERPPARLPLPTATTGCYRPPAVLENPPVRLSIASRIFLVFAAVVTVFGAVSSFAVWRMHAVGADIRLVSEGYLPLTKVAAQLETFHKNKQ